MQGEFSHPFMLPWSHSSAMMPHAVGAEHILAYEMAAIGWESRHKDMYHRFREPLGLEKISKIIESNFQPPYQLNHSIKCLIKSFLE